MTEALELFGIMMAIMLPVSLIVLLLSILNIRKALRLNWASCGRRLI
ncbi:MAG: hypothetical protein HN872_12840 [Gammaproteobacteria bacterium]|jgi:uncharacterized membrane protein|nr:hypothetical protein [Gammaproteobacteria bacterium]MDB3908384.1 hypothetical protein [Gammaproteobacteria bacterium]MDC0414297.1 hypothetical protein [Gammaproteobacteria bacterium]